MFSCKVNIFRNTFPPSFPSFPVPVLMHCRMQRQPLLVPLVSFTSNRIRSLRALVFSSFFQSSMETTSFSPSIDSTDASIGPPLSRERRSCAPPPLLKPSRGESAKEFGFGRAEFGRDSLLGDGTAVRPALVLAAQVARILAA
ncbi:hypothetical protein KFK09_028613 [Dendrobium nobile]|uniref:Uncharacterized protein n=1 Tax=Dendrobium nobile TaxID=94219 RepID=A0A8T3A2D7_DENNO|nr:hypothetical protein KFK09_028613 [Dendrobium nobile]